MSPPPAAALALLGIWVLVIFFVTNETGYAQLLSDGDDAVTAPDPESATAESDEDTRTTDPDSESTSTAGIRSPADD